MMARQVRRGIFGAVAVVLGVAVLALAEVAGWQALRLAFQPILATLILLWNQSGDCGCGVRAAQPTQSHMEQEALRVRQRALEAARGSLVFTAALPHSPPPPRRTSPRP